MSAALLMFGGAAWLGATWLAYPAWLAWRARGRGPVGGHGLDPEVRVVIVVVARDAAGDMARRLAELAALDGPARTILVVDDGSRDDTAAIAAATGVHVVRQPARGKAAGLAHAVEVLEAGTCGPPPDVLVLADVRQHIPRGALTALLAPLSDARVGVVSGVVSKPAARGAGLYWRYESWVRRLESRSGSTIGATGPWYALRRALFVPPPAGLVLDDVWLPMQAVLQGARAVVAEDARVVDVEHAAAVERDKKARTLTGNLQLVELAPELLDPRANPVWGRFVVHKLMRLGTPFALGAVALGGIVSALTPGPLQPLGVALGVGVVAVLVAARLGWAPARTLVAVSGASLEAWWRWLRRDFRWSTRAAGNGSALESGAARP